MAYILEVSICKLYQPRSSFLGYPMRGSFICGPPTSECRFIQKIRQFLTTKNQIIIYLSRLIYVRRALDTKQGLLRESILGVSNTCEAIHGVAIRCGYISQGYAVVNGSTNALFVSKQDGRRCSSIMAGSIKRPEESTTRAQVQVGAFKPNTNPI